MTSSKKIFPLLLLSFAFMSCGRSDAGEVRQSYAMTELSLSLYDASGGVHPNRSVLSDAANPFRQATLTSGDQWQQFQALRLDDQAHLVARFYFWASWLAQKPTGERQFMTALALRELYEQQNDAGKSRLYARIWAAFTAVITYFPEELSYDSQGHAYKLADAAQNILRELNENP